MQAKSTLGVFQATKWIAVCSTLIGLMASAQGQADSLVYVVERGDLKALRTRLASGENPNKSDDSIVKGWTPLMAAADRGNVEAARLLLEYGAVVDARTQYGSTALDITARHRDSASRQVAELLRSRVTNGAALPQAQAPPAQGMPGKARPADNELPLRAAGATDATTDYYRQFRNPLAEAAARGDVAAVRSLLAGGANPNEAENSSVKGWTPLMAAAKAGSADAAEALLAAHSDVNATNEYGATALDVAIASHGKPSALAALIETAGGRSRDGAPSGYRVVARSPSDNGEAPLHDAAGPGHKDEEYDALMREVAELLRNHDGRETRGQGVATTRKIVQEAQQRLQILGYGPGSADGLMGSRTTTALRKFQSEHDLAVTGVPDRKTLDALGPAPARQDSGIVLRGLAAELVADKNAVEKLAADLVADKRAMDELANKVVPTRQEMQLDRPIKVGESFPVMVGSNGVFGAPFRIRTVPEEGAEAQLLAERSGAAAKLAADEAAAKLAADNLAGDKVAGANLAAEKPDALIIRKALYGDLPDGPTVDVTDKVRAMVTGGTSLVVSWGQFEDPAKGARPTVIKVITHSPITGDHDVTYTVKDDVWFFMRDTKMTVYYKYGDGETRSREVPEGVEGFTVQPGYPLYKLRVDYTLNGVDLSKTQDGFKFEINTTGAGAH